MIDGKMQSAEVDEFIYHECLIHPPLLCHPKSVSLITYDFAISLPNLIHLIFY